MKIYFNMTSSCLFIFLKLGKMKTGNALVCLYWYPKNVCRRPLWNFPNQMKWKIGLRSCLWCNSPSVAELWLPDIWKKQQKRTVKHFCFWSRLDCIQSQVFSFIIHNGTFLSVITIDIYSQFQIANETTWSVINWFIAIFKNKCERFQRAFIF